MIATKTSTVETLIRALWLEDVFLLDKRVPGLNQAPSESSSQAPPEAVLLRPIQVLGIADEESTLRAIRRFLDEEPTLLQVLDCLCRTLLEVRQGLPRVREDPLARRSARLLDPDALVCLHPQLALPAQENYDWAVLPMSASDGAGLLREGSVDTHIHLGGALAPAFYWLALMGGELPLEVLSRLPTPHRGHAPAEDWQKKVALAMRTRLMLAYKIQSHGNGVNGQWIFAHLPGPEAEPWRPFKERKAEIRSRETSKEVTNEHEMALGKTADAVLALSAEARQQAWSEGRDRPFADPLRSNDTPMDSPHFAEGERRLLVRVGAYLRNRRARGQADEATENQLLEYLRVRNAFHRLLCHDHGANGLLRFIEAFGRRGFQYGVLRPRGKPGRRQRRYRRLVRTMEHARMRAALDGQLVRAFGEEGMKSSTLTSRDLEMRVTLPAGPHCLMTMRAWLDGIGDHLGNGNGGAPRGSRIGLVFHLLKHPAKPAAEQRRLALEDAQRLASILTGYPMLRRFVVGLDAAGAERGTAPRALAPAFACLRKLQAQLRPLPGEPPIDLGWTYHVGEDVDDLATGLRHLEEVVAHLLDGGEGRIGHGLVLGMDAARFYTHRGGEVELPVGAHLLDLVWAWGRLVNSTEDGRAARIKGRVRDLVRRHSEAVEQPDIEACWSAMDLEPGGRPADVSTEEDLTSEADLLKLLGFNANKADEPFVLHADSDWIELVTILQGLVRDRLARTRVTVEVNPTSNLVIGNFPDYGVLPYWRMVNSGLAVSINTDDPGLFATSLSNEFAVLYRTMNGEMTHRDVARWLEERRRDATRSSFLGPQVPAGAQALELLRDEKGTVLAYSPRDAASALPFP